MFRPACIALLGLGLSACDLTAPDGPGDPEVPRPDAQLLVERYSRAGARSFYTMSIDRRFIAPFPNVPGDATQLFAAPNGNQIAWLRDTDDLVHLWLMDRFGNSRRPLLDDTRVVTHVAWSPNSERLAVGGSTLEESDDIWVLNVNGTGLTNLTPDPKPAIYADRSPSWSPDGSRIAFVSNRSGTMHLWVMNADGSNKTQVVPPSVQGAERSAAWSYDGRLIAFVGSAAQSAGVGVVQPNGEGYRFFPTPGDAGSVGWLPDGRLLYSANTTGDYELYARNLISDEVTNLTQHSDHDFRATVLARGTPGTWRGFTPAQTTTASITNPSAIVIADLNADGHRDVAVAAPEQAQLRLWTGAATGLLTPLGSLDAPGVQQDLLSADVSADRVDDLILLGEREILVYRGSAAGPGLPSTHGVAADARGIALRDVDGSGVPTIAVTADRPNEGFRMLFFGDNGTGTGTIIPLLDMPTDFVRAGRLCSADITGGGHLDLVAATATSAASLVLFPGRGDISLDAPVVAASGGGTSRSTRMICSDFDGDGRADVALFDPGQRGLVVRRSQGLTLGSATPIDVVGASAVAADMDADGDADIVMASSDAPNLLYLRNLGDGRFAAASLISLSTAATQLAAGDLNGDGWPDLVTVSAAGVLTVLHNQGRL